MGSATGSPARKADTAAATARASSSGEPVGIKRVSILPMLLSFQSRRQNRRRLLRPEFVERAARLCIALRREHGGREDRGILRARLSDRERRHRAGRLIPQQRERRGLIPRRGWHRHPGDQGIRSRCRPLCRLGRSVTRENHQGSFRRLPEPHRDGGLAIRDPLDPTPNSRRQQPREPRIRLPPVRPRRPDVAPSLAQRRGERRFRRAKKCPS